MTGCRLGAKNTLVKNYLYLAEQAGAEVLPARPRPSRCVPASARRSGYEVTTVRTGALLRRRRPVLAADQVIFAAGALGTQRLLHRMRATGALPALSARVGELTRTNSEAILGASVPRRAARRRGSTSPTAWRSPVRSIPTRTRTSSRSATAAAPTRWACCRPRSCPAARAARCGGSARSPASR